MMNLSSNSKGQRDTKLNEYRQVADRVRGARCRDRQEIGKRRSSKPIHNNDGDNIFISPTPGIGGNPSTRGLFSLPVQDPDLNSHETSAFLPGSIHLWDKNLTDQASAPSVTPKEQTEYLKGRGEVRRNQSRSDGQMGEPFSQRLLSSEIPEEEQVQCGKRLAKPKGTGEAPESQPLSDGKTNDSSSQRLLLSEAPNEEMAQVDKSTTELSKRRHLS